MNQFQGLSWENEVYRDKEPEIKFHRAVNEGGPFRCDGTWNRNSNWLFAGIDLGYNDNQRIGNRIRPITLRWKITVWVNDLNKSKSEYTPRWAVRTCIGMIEADLMEKNLTWWPGDVEQLWDYPISPDNYVKTLTSMPIFKNFPNVPLTSPPSDWMKPELRVRKWYRIAESQEIIIPQWMPQTYSTIGGTMNTPGGIGVWQGTSLNDPVIRNPALPGDESAIYSGGASHFTQGEFHFGPNDYIEYKKETQGFYTDYKTNMYPWIMFNVGGDATGQGAHQEYFVTANWELSYTDL